MGLQPDAKESDQRPAEGSAASAVDSGSATADIPPLSDDEARVVVRILLIRLDSLTRSLEELRQQNEMKMAEIAFHKRQNAKLRKAIAEERAKSATLKALLAGADTDGGANSSGGVAPGVVSAGGSPAEDSRTNAASVPLRNAGCQSTAIPAIATTSTTTEEGASEGH